MPTSTGRYEDVSLRVRKDGSVFNVLITAIRDPSGNLTSFAKVVRDITEHKASEQRLRDSERLATLGTTAAAFAHEVANPLNGLSSCLEIVGNLLDDSHNPALKETVQAANQEMSRLISLLADYRSFARPQTLNIQPSNLRKIVEEVLAPNIHNYRKLGVSVTVQFDEDLPLVPLDPEKIRQVILNFCNNAVEAMPKGGMLTVRGYRLNENAVLEIRDTGQGIPKDFDPFQLFKTTKPQGTGLGLSIVQQFISDHRGAVDYVSELGMGATFRVSLRLVAR